MVNFLLVGIVFIGACVYSVCLIYCLYKNDVDPPLLNIENDETPPKYEDII